MSWYAPSSPNLMDTPLLDTSCASSHLQIYAAMLIYFVRPPGFEPGTGCLEGRCSIQLSYERVRLLASSSTGPIVGPVSRLRHRSGFVRRANVSLIKSISIPVSPLTSVDLVECSSVLFSLTSRTIFSVFLLVIALLELHVAKLQKWKHIYPTSLGPCMPCYSSLSFCFWIAWFLHAHPCAERSLRCRDYLLLVFLPLL